MVASGMEQRRQQLIGALREYSIWDAMDDNVNGAQLNSDWLKINLSGSAYINQSINIEAIVDRQQQVNYLLIDGKFVPPATKADTLNYLIANLFPLAEKYNPYAKSPSPLGYLKMTEQGVDVYYLVIMEPIAPEHGAKLPENGRFLLFASELDAAWVGALGNNFKLLKPHVSANVSEAEPTLALTSPQGALQGYLTWQLDMPGSRFFPPFCRI